MKVQLGKDKGKKDKSLALFHGEAASSSMENAGCAYQAPSVIAAGASAQGVAFLSCLTNIILAFLLLKVPGLVEGNRSSLKRTTIIIAIVNTLSWLPLVFVLFFMKNFSPFLIIALWTINLVPTTLVYPLRDNWMASLIPQERIGRYLSMRAITAGVVYLVSFYLMGFVLDRTTGLGGYGYAFILAFAFLATSISCVFYLGISPPKIPETVERTPALSFTTFLKDIRKSHLGTFILFVSLYTFAVSMASPLFAAYMLKDLQFSYLAFTIIISGEYIFRILSLTLWGKQIDRVGSLRILNVVAYFIPFIPICWIFSTNFVYLFGIQMMSGIVWAAFDLSVQTFVYKTAAPEQRLRYIVYYRSLITASTALGAVTGGLMLNHIFAIFGSQILGMFLISGLLRLFVARMMLPRLVLQHIPDTVTNPEPGGEFVRIPNAIKTGLYYYPDAWARFTRQVVSAGSNIIGRAVSTVAPSQNGLFYKPAKWIEYRNRTNPQPVTAEIGKIAPTAREGLFYRREAWNSFQSPPVSGKSGTDIKQAVNRNGLFHNPQQWGNYLGQSLALNAATIRTGSDGQTLRQPVFYHPEVWQKYQKEAVAFRKNPVVKSISAREAIYHQTEKWQKYGTQSTKLMGKQLTPRINTTLNSTNRIPGYYKPQDTGRQTDQNPALSGASRSTRSVLGVTPSLVRVSTTMV